MRISKEDFEKVESILKRSFPEDFDGIVALSGAAVIWDDTRSFDSKEGKS